MAPAGSPNCRTRASDFKPATPRAWLKQTKRAALGLSRVKAVVGEFCLRPCGLRNPAQALAPRLRSGAVIISPYPTVDDWQTLVRSRVDPNRRRTADPCSERCRSLT